MNYSSSERWAVLRELYETHGIPLEVLAVAGDKQSSTIANRAEKDNWSRNGEDAYSYKHTIGLISRFAGQANGRLSELDENGMLMPEAEKHLRTLTSIITALNKSLQVDLQLRQNADQRQEMDTDAAGNSGEDVLALRQDVEAFLVSIGGEEVDPAISGEID